MLSEFAQSENLSSSVNQVCELKQQNIINHKDTKRPSDGVGIEERSITKNVLFDSLDSEFHINIFIYQLLGHLFLPSILLFSPNLYAQGFRFSFASVFFNIIAPLNVYLFLLCYWLLTPEDKNIIGYSFVIPFLFFVMHRTTVSLKYATLSSTEYQRFMSCHDDTIISCYVNQMQLLSGWLQLDPTLTAFELSAASSRIGVKINQIYFRIPCSCSGSSSKVQDEKSSDEKQATSAVKYIDPPTIDLLQHWNAFLPDSNDNIDRVEIINATKPLPANEIIVSPQIVELPNGDYGVSVYNVCYAILQRVKRSGDIGKMLGSGLIVSMLLIGIMWYGGLRSWNQLASPGLVLVHMISASLTMMMFGTISFGFLVVAIFDVYRFLTMVRVLHGMIRLTDLMLHRSIITKNAASVLKKNVRLSIERQRTILSISSPPVQRQHGNKNTSILIAADEEANDEELYGPQFQPTLMWSFFSPKGVNSNKVGTQDVNTIVNQGMTFATVPKIELYYADNATAWIYARLVVQNFGLRFRFRTDVYIAFTLFLVMVMMIVALVAIIMSTDKTSTYTSPLFLESIVIVCLSIIDMIVISFLGSNANEELYKHCRTLAAQAMKIKTKLYRFYSKGHEHEQHLYDQDQLENALSTVQDIKEVADINNELQPFKIVGLVASNGLTVSIITTAISFFGIVFSLSTGGSPLPINSNM